MGRESISAGLVAILLALSSFGCGEEPTVVGPDAGGHPKKHGEDTRSPVEKINAICTRFDGGQAAELSDRTAALNRRAEKAKDDATVSRLGRQIAAMVRRETAVRKRATDAIAKSEGLPGDSLAPYIEARRLSAEKAELLADAIDAYSRSLSGRDGLAVSDADAKVRGAESAEAISATKLKLDRCARFAS